MRTVGVARPLALLGAAIVGAVVVISVRGGAAAPAAPAPRVMSTAPVLRGDLSATVLSAGTLGYGAAGPIVNQLTGTYTKLPRVGATITAGHALYRVDNVPAFLMAGSTPAWRAFAPGMSDGPDVAELQSDLISLGDASGLLSTATGQFDAATLYAVERWQETEGLFVTGEIPFGEAVFLRSAVRVGAESVAPGQIASAGAVPYQVTTAARTVTVPVTPTLPSVALGERVSIQLPSGASTPGQITDIGPAAATGSPGSGGSGTSTVLTITPDRPAATGSGTGVAVQVSLTVQSVHAALTVPVSALLALAGGGYGLEVVAPSGAHRLVAVQTGLFAGSRVQVSGVGIGPGTKVVVAQ